MDLNTIAGWAGLLGAIVSFLVISGKFSSKAKEEGRRDERMENFKEDLNKLGGKVESLQNDHANTKNKVTEIDTMLISELRSIGDNQKEIKAAQDKMMSLLTDHITATHS